MRYLFTMLCVIISWGVIVVIANSPELQTQERFVLFLCAILLTLGIYKVGFSKR